jgi:alginate O-acetyltransferase complex protein AlgI
MLAMLLTFSLTVFAWIFFRSENMGQAFHFIGNIFSLSLFVVPQFLPYLLFGLMALFILVEWIGREHPYAIQKLTWFTYTPLRWAFYVLLINLILLFQSENQEFIYFQF